MKSQSWKSSSPFLYSFIQFEFNNSDKAPRLVNNINGINGALNQPHQPHLEETIFSEVVSYYAEQSFVLSSARGINDSVEIIFKLFLGNY